MCASAAQSSISPPSLKTVIVAVTGGKVYCCDDAGDDVEIVGDGDEEAVS